LRITFLMTQSLDSPGGTGRFLPLAKALTALGHQVTLLALHHDFAHVARRRFIQEGVHVHYVGQMHVRKSGDHKYYYNPVALTIIALAATLRLTIAALRTPGDVIHVCKTQPMNGLAAWIVHRLRGTAIYLDSDDYEAVNNRFTGRWQQRIVAWFEDWLPSFAAGITVNTTFIARRFAAIGYPPGRIYLVPNGVDHERFCLLKRPDLPSLLAERRAALGIEATDRVVVYVGSLSLVSHAIDLLLEAFPLVLQQEPQAILLVVGGGEDLPRLQQQAKALPIDERVRFLGRVPGDQAPLYYALGEVSVDPMRRSLPAESSLSLKVVESIVAGVPCVTADIGDRKHIVGAAGIAVAPDDAAALAGGILAILKDKEVADRMRQAAQATGTEHWWQTRVHLFTRVYQA
jgi:glycosyltransferase involved in cell wall biosynthesis